MDNKTPVVTHPFPHLQTYRATLQAAAAHWFAQRGLRTRPGYSYILHSFAQWPQNIILPEVAAYIQHKQAANKGVERFPLHQYLHHGLSSQAMLFNLLGPLLVRKDLAPVQAAFIAAGAPWPGGKVHAELEVSDSTVFHEDTGQPTSLDCAILGMTGAPLFVECKLSETGFGGCSVYGKRQCAGNNPLHDLSACYLHRIGRTYWQRAGEQGLNSTPWAAESLCPLAKSYQFYRESLFALTKGGHFVLLYDARSPVFVHPDKQGSLTAGLWPSLVAQTPPAIRQRLHAVTIQAIVTEIEKSRNHRDWIGVFKKKYGLSE